MVSIEIFGIAMFEAIMYYKIRKAFLVYDDTAINERVLEVRKALGLTQTEFGKGINVSQAYFGNIEQKKRKVNDRIIALICSSYGVNANWLKNGTGKMFEKPQDGKLERIIRNFKKLDPLLQDYVIKQIDLAVEFQEIQNRKSTTSP